MLLCTGSFPSAYNSFASDFKVSYFFERVSYMSSALYLVSSAYCPPFSFYFFLVLLPLSGAYKTTSKAPAATPPKNPNST
jgi:hypothetical protein